MKVSTGKAGLGGKRIILPYRRLQSDLKFICLTMYDSLNHRTFLMLYW